MSREAVMATPSREHLWLAVIAQSVAMLAPTVMSYGQTVELAASHPQSGDKEVPVSASIHLRFNDALDPESLSGLAIQEVGGSDVPVRRVTDLTHASITLSPINLLKTRTVYEVHGSRVVRSEGNRASLLPFEFRFTTGAVEFDRGERLVFEPQVFDRTRSTTTVLFGPDKRLYAADAFGSLVRWDIDEAGVPVNRQVLLSDPKRSRQYIDLEWDPATTPEQPILWVSYGERLWPAKDPYRYFTGAIARLELDEDGVRRTRVVVRGLPHGREKQGGFDTLPHQPNGLVFHNGKLYQSVGSTSSSGGPPNWGLAEQPLSASIIEIDYKRIHKTLDVSPASGFDPAADSPVRVFATGVRNALELAAHSNGRLYTAVNINDRAGRADGVPDDPDIPGDQNVLVKQTTPNHESLLILERGRHYGFPNPSRQQYVLAGGNPTRGKDPFEIDDYPVGTMPERGFAPELMFPLWRWGGTSPNGMIEYTPSFSHSLSGALICCFYSAGDLAVMMLGSDGLPVSVEKLRAPGKKKLSFAGPIDVTLDPDSGILYVANFGAQNKFGEDGSLVLLRPRIKPR